jgi:tripartite-type tricarboxylate transporter receptor subunit TctC
MNLRLPRPRLHRSMIAAVLGIMAIALLALTGDGARAQGRPIKIINPFPAGGTADIIARVVADQIGRTRGAAMVIEDHPGAGSAIGAELVARAPPDGNTLLIGTSAILINAYLHKTNYDSLKSFEPICNLVQSPQLLFVNEASPYRTIADIVAAARARPGEVSIASTGPGTTAHISVEMLKRVAKADITYVPFPGNAPTVNATLGGHVGAGNANYADVAQQFKAGTLRPVVTFTPARIEPLPDLQTIAEAGYPDSQYVTWFGMFAPAKTPKDLISQYAGWFTGALQAPEVKAKLIDQGLYPTGTCGADFSAAIAKENQDLGRVIHEANIKVE